MPPKPIPSSSESLSDTTTPYTTTPFYTSVTSQPTYLPDQISNVTADQFSELNNLLRPFSASYQGQNQTPFDITKNVMPPFQHNANFAMMHANSLQPHPIVFNNNNLLLQTSFPNCPPGIIPSIDGSNSSGVFLTLGMQNTAGQSYNIPSGGDNSMHFPTGLIPHTNSRSAPRKRNTQSSNANAGTKGRGRGKRRKLAEASRNVGNSNNSTRTFVEPSQVPTTDLRSENLVPGNSCNSYQNMPRHDLNVHGNNMLPQQQYPHNTNMDFLRSKLGMAGGEAIQPTAYTPSFVDTTMMLSRDNLATLRKQLYNDYLHNMSEVQIEGRAANTKQVHDRSIQSSQTLLSLPVSPNKNTRSEQPLDLSLKKNKQEGLPGSKSKKSPTVKNTTGHSTACATSRNPSVRDKTTTLDGQKSNILPSHGPSSYTWTQNDFLLSRADNDKAEKKKTGNCIETVQSRPTQHIESNSTESVSLLINSRPESGIINNEKHLSLDLSTKITNKKASVQHSRENVFNVSSTVKQTANQMFKRQKINLHKSDVSREMPFLSVAEGSGSLQGETANTAEEAKMDIGMSKNSSGRTNFVEKDNIGSESNRPDTTTLSPKQAMNDKITNIDLSIINSKKPVEWNESESNTNDSFLENSLSPVLVIDEDANKSNEATEIHDDIDSQNILNNSQNVVSPSLKRNVIIMEITNTNSNVERINFRDNSNDVTGESAVNNTDSITRKTAEHSSGITKFGIANEEKYKNDSESLNNSECNLEIHRNAMRIEGKTSQSATNVPLNTLGNNSPSLGNIDSFLFYPPKTCRSDSHGRAPDSLCTDDTHMKTHSLAGYNSKKDTECKNIESVPHNIPITTHIYGTHSSSCVITDSNVSDNFLNTVSTYVTTKPHVTISSGHRKTSHQPFHTEAAISSSAATDSGFLTPMSVIDVFQGENLIQKRAESNRIPCSTNSDYNVSTPLPMPYMAANRNNDNRGINDELKGKRSERYEKFILPYERGNNALTNTTPTKRQKGAYGRSQGRKRHDSLITNRGRSSVGRKSSTGSHRKPSEKVRADDTQDYRDMESAFTNILTFPLSSSFGPDANKRNGGNKTSGKIHENKRMNPFSLAASNVSSAVNVDNGSSLSDLHSSQTPKRYSDEKKGNTTARSLQSHKQKGEQDQNSDDMIPLFRDKIDDKALYTRMSCQGSVKAPLGNREASKQERSLSHVSLNRHLYSEEHESFTSLKKTSERNSPLQDVKTPSEDHQIQQKLSVPPSPSLWSKPQLFEDILDLEDEQNKATIAPNSSLWLSEEKQRNDSKMSFDANSSRKGQPVQLNSVNEKFSFKKEQDVISSETNKVDIILESMKTADKHAKQETEIDYFDMIEVGAEVTIDAEKSPKTPNKQTNTIEEN